MLVRPPVQFLSLVSWQTDKGATKRRRTKQEKEREREIEDGMEKGRKESYIGKIGKGKRIVRSKGEIG